MAVVRKVQSRVILPSQTKPESGSQSKNLGLDHDRSRFSRSDEETDNLKSIVAKKKKFCAFCRNKIQPHYWDSQSLRRFVNDRGRIVPRVRTGNCAKHQKRVTLEIKYARHLALLPFIVRV